jgi:hypothetical protein
MGDYITIPTHLLTAQHQVCESNSPSAQHTRTAPIGIPFSHVKPIFIAHIIITQSIACYNISTHKIDYTSANVTAHTVYIHDLIRTVTVGYSTCTQI